MFRQTKIKLVSLYTLVFFLLLNALGISTYLYMERISFLTIDENLDSKANHFLLNPSKEIPEESGRESDRRISYITWDKNKKAIKSYPKKAFFQNDYPYFSPAKNPEKLRTVKISNHSYRVLTIKTPNVVVDQKIINTIQLIYNIDPEVHMLRNLLLMMGVGSGAGLILSVLVGFFLANKALVPIQKSWEKQAQFVADASHELRTPLSVIQTHLELLFRHPSNTIEQESEVIFKSLSEVKRVNKLVADLLTLARSDSNEQLLNRQDFSITVLLHLIVEQFTPIAELKEIQIIENIRTEVLFKGDQERLHQLFVILMDNAIKFTGKKGKIQIGCWREGNALIIVVEDNGIGISKEDLPHIFDRFYRSDKVRSRAEGGTGLGLSIAKWIVVAHHGQISVESKQNVGTKFTIKLPI
ncbi:sensor histidine kinase [Neobacillus sp. SM06]|uniref:sensor histidine kinase n=1 Tax=Neobacillus sp. SM06 TaxID=3422492 RepID=UPI003D279DB5